MAEELEGMIDGDLVKASLTDGTDTLEMDLAAEQALLLTLSAPTTVTFESQEINYQGEKKDSKWEGRDLTVTWTEEAESLVRNWELTRPANLTYSITGYGGTSKSWSNCVVRITDPAKIMPKTKNYTTFTFTVTSYEDPYKSVEA